MKPSPLRPEADRVSPAARLTRRGFCQAAGLGVITFALPACFGGDGVRRLGVGQLDDGGNEIAADGGVVDLASNAGADLSGARPPDLAAGKPADLRQSPPDLASASSCGNGVFATKRAPSAFALNTATYFQADDIFVCRDGGGLFALSSLCTHAGCTIEPKVSGSPHFYCPCHGATFTLNGAVTGGPTNTPLDHYAVCVAGDGTISVDANTIVSSTSRLAV